MVGRASWTTDLSVSGVVDTERILDRRTDATRDLFVTSNSEIPSNKPCCMDHPEGCLIIVFFNTGDNLDAT